MEADTLKKQTCFSRSVYTLWFLSLSLSLFLSLFHYFAWQLLDCFTSRSPWRWLLRGKSWAHILFLLTAIHCMFVSGCPNSQYYLDARLRPRSGEDDHTRQGVSFNLTWRNHGSKHPIFRGNEQLEKVNTLQNTRVRVAAHLVSHIVPTETLIWSINPGCLWLEDVVAKIIRAPTRSENSDR